MKPYWEKFHFPSFPYFWLLVTKFILLNCENIQVIVKILWNFVWLYLCIKNSLRLVMCHFRQLPIKSKLKIQELGKVFNFPLKINNIQMTYLKKKYHLSIFCISYIFCFLEIFLICIFINIWFLIFVSYIFHFNLEFIFITNNFNII